MRHYCQLGTRILPLYISPPTLISRRFALPASKLRQLERESVGHSKSKQSRNLWGQYSSNECFSEADALKDVLENFSVRRRLESTDLVEEAENTVSSVQMIHAAEAIHELAGEGQDAVELSNVSRPDESESTRKRRSPRELEFDFASETNPGEMFRETFASFIYVCYRTGQVERAFESLQFYSQLGQSDLFRRKLPLNDISNYNRIIEQWAMSKMTKETSPYKATDMVKEMWEMISLNGAQPNLDTIYSLALLLGKELALRYSSLPKAKMFQSDQKDSVVAFAKKLGLLSLLDSSTMPPLAEIFSGRMRTENDEVVMSILQAISARSVGEIKLTQSAVSEPIAYDCKLLNRLQTDASCEMTEISEKSRNLLVQSSHSVSELQNRQHAAEISGTVRVCNVVSKAPTDEELRHNGLFSQLLVEWKESLSAAFASRLKHLSKLDVGVNMTVLPFLECLPAETYVAIMHQELQQWALLGPGYSDSVQAMSWALGKKVYEKFYQATLHREGISWKLQEIYSQFLRRQGESGNVRQLWTNLSREIIGRDVRIDCLIPRWPDPVLYKVGSILMSVLLRSTLMYKNIEHENYGLNPGKQLAEDNVLSFWRIPAFCKLYRNFTITWRTEIVPCQQLLSLVQKAGLRSEVPTGETLSFGSSMLPRVVPPIPWIAPQYGGYVLTPVDVVRSKDRNSQAFDSMRLLRATSNEKLAPIFDSLNQLGSVAWNINTKVLQVMLPLFQTTGSEKLGLPPPEAKWPTLPISPLIERRKNPEMDAREYQRLLWQYDCVHRQRAKLQSERCSVLYKLSVASHFRESDIWFPFTMDFRGRVYPCPSVLNHMGDDVSRGLLQFAEGRPLGGPKPPHNFSGLDWLKIHCMNKAGLARSGSLKERLDLANQNLTKIKDSAADPLSETWWQNDEDPWQTLAACFEIADALNLADPSEFVSHLPIHQDGTCNGLQHYVAMGLDNVGAGQVNILPSERPADIYSAVLHRVLAKITKHASDKSHPHYQLARKVLAGNLVTRKVVKQPVMTSVYGVTQRGARNQVLRRLKEIRPNSFDLFPAADYIGGITLASIDEVCESAKLIQDWLSGLSGLISEVVREPIQWETPLGLPVIQPYMSKTTKQCNLKKKDKASCEKLDDSFAPETKKQRRAFPPNFVHSLDSTHMMLTSLHCQRAGITYASVHDCYWTHACSVDRMNEICREQFVNLYAHDPLKQLAEFLHSKLATDDALQLMQGTKRQRIPWRYLQHQVKNIPAKGELKLEEVKQSVYFFH